jgi:two-component system, cell cycle sensor histidine kinase PleC
MLMNGKHSVRVGRAASLTLMMVCVGGMVTAYDLAARPGLVAAVAVLLGSSLLVAAIYFFAAPIASRFLKLEGNANAGLADAIAGLKAGIALFDRHDRMVVANPTYRQIHEIIADMLVPGVPFETILRENVRRSRFDLGEAEAEAYIQRRLQQHRNPGPVVERRLNDGRWEQVREQRLRDGGLLLVILDITEDKTQQMKLTEAMMAAEGANQAKTKFLATMSHELRTPLNAIIGFSDMMLTGMFGPIGSPKYLEYAGDVHRSGHYLLSMINEILDLSKIEAGRYELDPEDIDVAVVIQECVSIVRVTAEQHDVELTVTASRPLHANADNRAFKQILLNLLSNAVKFTPPGGRVSLRATIAAEGMITVAVADTGIGIAATDLDRIFEPFQRGDASVARAHEGTGLGLAITKGLVELSGGKLALESQSGLGTTVTVWLPAARPGLIVKQEGVARVG